MSQLLATKPLDRLMSEAKEHSGQGLQRALGPMNLVALGIGAVIGAGIFVITGSAAAQFAGPAIILSFLLAGLGCAFAGLCYAELASMIPIAGSAYTYGYATLGEIFAWVIGWDLVLEYAFSAATVASTAASGFLRASSHDFTVAPTKRWTVSGRLSIIFKDVSMPCAGSNTPASANSSRRTDFAPRPVKYVWPGGP